MDCFMLPQPILRLEKMQEIDNNRDLILPEFEEAFDKLKEKILTGMDFKKLKDNTIVNCTGRLLLFFY